jgi:TolB-like protein/tetratricopeptide (TPR) repeat protein
MNTVEPTGASHDVFLSYASADAATADTVCRGLESTGLACWIAPRDVAPGAQYADAIVRAINGAQVLVLVLSESAVASAHVGKEIERASSKRRPIIALRIDAAPLTPAFEYFLSESQWIEAPGGALEAALSKLATAVRRLLHTAGMPADARAGGSQPFEPRAPLSSRPQPRARRGALLLAGAMAAVAALTAAVWHGLAPHSPAPPPVPPAVPAAAGLAPPPHSVAVLPFENLSGDRAQDYFSDGLSEELLNSLVTIRDLHVAARTSSFYFKGTAADTATIARRLNVGALLEGSVRKQATHVRISAQLINAVTGFNMWSKTYDRDLKDVLKVQTDVATEVTAALQATLMGGAAVHVDLGGTESPQAFDAFLRGEKGRRLSRSKARDLEQIAAYDEAIGLDPKFAKAYVGKAIAMSDLTNYLTPEAGQQIVEQALAIERRAIELAPDLGPAHTAYAFGLDSKFEFVAAAPEFEQAVALAPGDSEVLRASAEFLSGLGHAGQALERARRAVELDPLNPETHGTLGRVLFEMRRYQEAIAAYDQAVSLNPANNSYAVFRGFVYLSQGQYEAARADCETPPIDWANRTCLAITYEKLHRAAEARAALQALTAATGETASYQYAQIHAQWGDLPKSLDWLDTGYRIHDPGMQNLKTDPLMDPVRSQARYRAVLAHLKLPD